MEVVFQISLHRKDLEIINLIQKFFEGIGTISFSSKDMCAFRVTSSKDILNQIIPHFDKYNLISQKQADYLLFRRIIKLIEQGHHLNKDGIQDIINIRASINLGLSEVHKSSFPNTIPVIRPIISLSKIIHPEWMSGFISGDNDKLFCLKTKIFKDGIVYNKNYKSRNNVSNFCFNHRYFSTKRLTDNQKESFVITPQLHEIIIGSIIGDLNICKLPKGKNVYLRFEQGKKNEDYILYLYDLFKDYCASEPKKTDRFDKRTNKTYTRIIFQTYSLPCLNYYHSLFYVEGIKTIPENIGELLSPIGLAFWAQDDGSAKRHLEIIFI